MLENITPTAIQVSELPGGDSSTPSGSDPMGIYPASPIVPPPKKFPFLLTILLLFLSGLAAISIYLLIQVRLMAIEKTTLPQAPSPTPISSPDPTADWQSFTIEDLQLSFRIPEKLASNREWKTEAIPGETGSNVCFHAIEEKAWVIRPIKAGGIGICSGKLFTVNSNSSDFTAGRGGGFGDYSGYVAKSGEYFLLNQEGKAASEPIDRMLAHEAFNSNGVAYLIILGERTDNPGQLLPSDSVGAIINTYNQKYPGIIVTMQISQNASMKDFEDILSTFKFTNTSSYKCPESGYVDCMPVLDEAKKQACSEDAMKWYKANCPGFQGGAL